MLFFGCSVLRSQLVDSMMSGAHFHFPLVYTQPMRVHPRTSLVDALPMSVRVVKHIEPSCMGIHVRTGASPGNFGRTRQLTKIEFSTSFPILIIRYVSYRIKRDREIIRSDYRNHRHKTGRKANSIELDIDNGQMCNMSDNKYQVKYLMLTIPQGYRCANVIFKKL